MVRAVAHSVFPYKFSQPVILANDLGESAGFYLEHDQAVHSCEDMCATTLNEQGEIDWLGPLEETPKQIEELKTDMERFNIRVYDANWLTLREQLLLDENGDFVTFARLGYIDRYRGGGFEL